MTRFLEKLARWYYLNYLRPLILADLKAQQAKETLPRKRYVGDARHTDSHS